MIADEATMRGEPNSVTSHFASKPADETSELSGSVLPPKLGDGQLERNAAATSLPAYCSVERAGAAQADDRFERHAQAAVRYRRKRRVREHQRGGAAGRTIARDFEARDPLLLDVVDHDVVARAQPGEARGGAECDRGLVPEEARILVEREIAQECLGRNHEHAAHLHPGVVHRGVEQAALALLRVQHSREVKPRRRDLEILTPAFTDPVGDHQGRTVEVLLRSPVAGELLLHAILARLALLDQAGDQQVRHDGREREAADQRDLVE